MYNQYTATPTNERYFYNFTAGSSERPPAVAVLRPGLERGCDYLQHVILTRTVEHTPQLMDRVASTKPAPVVLCVDRSRAQDPHLALSVCLTVGLACPPSPPFQMKLTVLKESAFALLPSLATSLALSLTPMCGPT